KVFEDKLCTFPVVSRTFCEMAGGICPRDYVRYRIDDHIEDVFNLLRVLGERRTVYLPAGVFEHANYLANPAGVRQYFSEPEIVVGDARRFEAFLPGRKELVLQLMRLVTSKADQVQIQGWRNQLVSVHDSLALRVPGRQRIVWGPWDRLRTRAGRLI